MPHSRHSSLVCATASAGANARILGGAALAVCQIKIIKLDRSPTLPLQCAGGKFNQADYGG
jgi:hypothetical protein